MPAITFNGAARAVPEDTTVSQLVAAALGRALDPAGQPADGGRLGVAVAVDAVVLPRSLWHTTPVADGQSIELVTAVQGG